MEEKTPKENNINPENPPKITNIVEQPPQEKSKIQSQNSDPIEKPIQLVLSTKDVLETTVEAINILTSLKKEKLCILSINGPSESGKSTLANNIIESENGFKVGIKTEGIWLWNNPILLENGNRLLVLDCQRADVKDEISHKLFLLSILLSTCVMYYTEGELNNNIIDDFVFFVELIRKIRIKKDEKNEKDSKDEKHDINKLKDYLPVIIFVNNISTEEEMQKFFEKKENIEFNQIKEKISYLNIKDKDGKIIISEMNKIKNKIIKNINIDGDSLFSLLQNYIDFLNRKQDDGKNNLIIINLAFENMILSKAKNTSELIFQQFKNRINEDIKYPSVLSDIYKKYYELQKEHFQLFCENVEKNLSPIKIGEFICKISDNMMIELQTILEKNKETIEEKLYVGFNVFTEKMNKINFSAIEEIKIFILSYTVNFKNCLDEFFDIIKSSFNKGLITLLNKIFEEFVSNKITKLGEVVNNLYETNSNKYKENIDNLNLNIKDMKEQIENYKKQIETNKKEISEKIKNYEELKSEMDKIKDDMKIKESEFEKKLKLEEEEKKKNEQNFKCQLKEKNSIIDDLKEKMQKLNSDTTRKIDELNEEKIKLQKEIEKINIKTVEINHEENDERIQTLFKNIQVGFTNFKETIDKLEKNNEQILKEKINYKEEIDSKLKNLQNEIKEIKTFCQSQIDEMKENYKKEILKANEQNKELLLKNSKVELDLKEQKSSNQAYENTLKEKENQITDMNNVLEASKNSIETQNKLIQSYQEKITNNAKKINDLEISLCKNIYNYKMSEDDFETLLIVIQSIILKDKNKYIKNVKKLGSKGKNFVNNLVEKYNIFSDV